MPVMIWEVVKVIFILFISYMRNTPGIGFTIVLISTRRLVMMLHPFL
jgi:hypothetical protein